MSISLPQNKGVLHSNAALLSPYINFLPPIQKIPYGTIKERCGEANGTLFVL